MRVETIGDCTLYLGDCREVLPTLTGIDAIVCDPPYGVGFRYASHDDSPVGYREWCSAWFAVARSACPGPIAISCGLANITEWPKPDWTLCWHKPAAMGRCVVGFNNWEPVLLYGKSRGAQNNDVFRAPILPSEDVQGHPCPKPVAWAEGILERITREGDTIADIFMGSGTTGVACVRMGRRFIGVEKEPAYFDIACRRIEEAYKQPRLFVEQAAKPVQHSLLGDAA